MGAWLNPCYTEFGLSIGQTVCMGVRCPENLGDAGPRLLRGVLTPGNTAFVFRRNVGLVSQRHCNRQGLIGYLGLPISVQNNYGIVLWAHGNYIE